MLMIIMSQLVKKKSGKIANGAKDAYSTGL
jgi:hypothetical protein